MSHSKPDPLPGLYRIVSVERSDSAASVNSYRPPPTQVVRLGEDAKVWEVKINPIGPHVYTFAIKGVYPYSGLSDDKKKVVGLNKVDHSVNWYVLCAKNKPGEYTIACDGRHDEVWTVCPEERINPEIMMMKLNPKIGPTSAQLFRFECVE